MSIRSIGRVLPCVLLLLAPAACAPRVQQLNAVVAEATLQETAAVMADGARLPYRVWRAERPRAVIIGVHGFNDYSNSISGAGAWLAKRGLTTYAYDQRGFGETAHPGLWAGTVAMVGDLKSFVALVRQRHRGLPLYLMGVSMGGAVTMVALADGPIEGVEGAILVAPAVWGWRTMNPVYRTGLWVAAHTMPWSQATGDGLDLQPTDNAATLRDLARDPLVIKQTRMDAVYGLVNLMDEAYAAAGRISTPLLVLYGRRDQIVPRKPVAEVVARLRASRRVVFYQNGWHMLLRDRQAKTVYRDIAAWIRDRDGPLPSGESATNLGVGRRTGAAATRSGASSAAAREAL